jgi:hypothetical protein
MTSDEKKHCGDLQFYMNEKWLSGSAILSDVRICGVSQNYLNENRQLVQFFWDKFYSSCIKNNLTHSLPVSGLPFKLLAQQFFY